MQERIGVFVDLISLFGSVKAAYNGRKIDYGRYLEKIDEMGIVTRAFAYGAFVGDEASNFISCLSSVGFEPKYVKAILFDGKPSVKETDRTMDMVVDILRVVDRIDTVVIGTLNTNWIPFIYYLKEKGLKVILFSCNVKKELRFSADLYIIVNETILEDERTYQEVKE